MIDIEQLKEYIIAPALSSLQAYSDDAVELMLFTCAVESDGGKYIHQIKGPALGIYQMEPETYTDLWINYVRHSNRIQQLLAVNFDAPIMQLADRLIYDLKFATVFARLQYMRNPETLPDRHKPNDIFEYYKKYYNTASGKATKAASIKKYKAYVDG